MQIRSKFDVVKRRGAVTARRACLEPLEDRRLLSFGLAANYATTWNPRAIATADFNRDGMLDLAATVNYDANTRVSVRLGDGAGGFGAAREFPAPVSGNASYFFIADLNLDTKPDMVVSDGLNGYGTLIGNGDGTFQPQVNSDGYGLVYAGHLQPGNAVVGIRTWIGADWETHVQLLWGNGQGGFTPAGQDGQYWGDGGVMVPVNLNNDASLDVVTGQAAVFMGEYWGLRFDAGYGDSLRGAVATGDFTGDGNADVVVASDSVAMLRGRGDGTLEAPVLYPANGTALSAVATADFNADGKLDVVVTDRNNATASVMLGNGDGTLRFGGAFAVGASPSSLTVGDFNGDRRPDVAVANNGSTNLSVLLNDGNWSVLPPPPPPPPALSVSDTTVTEGNTGTRNATFTVMLSKLSAIDVSVGYSTASGTAMPFEDYDLGGGTITIPAGQTSAIFTIAVIGDWIPEPNETFSVYLHTPTNAMITDAQGICTIVNDDVAPPRISINNVTKAEGKSGNTSFTFTVSLSFALTQAVSVNYTTTNGTAKAGSDYTARSGSVTFAPGETTKTITIVVKGDRTKESNETFFVDLFGASTNSLISVARGTGTILDDDNR